MESDSETKEMELNSQSLRLDGMVHVRLSVVHGFREQCDLLFGPTCLGSRDPKNICSSY